MAEEEERQDCGADLAGYFQRVSRSGRADRQPIKRHRDAAQTEAVAALVATYLTHLPFEAEQLRMLPKELVTEAAPLFVKTGTSGNS
jgi:membrane carboxypeptidase/penicillin-binding protein PbpC